MQVSGINSNTNFRGLYYIKSPKMEGILKSGGNNIQQVLEHNMFQEKVTPDIAKAVKESPFFKKLSSDTDVFINLKYNTAKNKEKTLDMTAIFENPYRKKQFYMLDRLKLSFRDLNRGEILKKVEQIIKKLPENPEKILNITDNKVPYFANLDKAQEGFRNVSTKDVIVGKLEFGVDEGSIGAGFDEYNPDLTRILTYFK